MGYEAFNIKDKRAAQIVQNAKKFGFEELQNAALVETFLNSERINLSSQEREEIERIFVNLMKIEESVQLSG